jgi:hypothetical protein
LGVSLVLLIACGVGGWFVYQNTGKWVADATRAVVVQMVNDSDLPEEEKAEIKVQLDRVVEKYKSGEITLEQVGKVMEKLVESPVFATLIVKAAEAKYIDPSGLDDEEKAQARLVLQRIARGTVEKKIDPKTLEPALDHISHTDPQGNRQLKEHVSDAELRDFIAELKRVADAAQIPDEPYEVNFGAEIRRAVDEALQEAK